MTTKYLTWFKNHTILTSLVFVHVIAQRVSLALSAQTLDRETLLRLVDPTTWTGHDQYSTPSMTIHQITGTPIGQLKIIGNGAEIRAGGTNNRALETKMEKIGQHTIRTIELDGKLNGIQGHGTIEMKKKKEILRLRPEAELKAKQNQGVKEMKKVKERLVALLQLSLPEAVA